MHEFASPGSQVDKACACGLDRCELRVGHDIAAALDHSPAEESCHHASQHTHTMLRMVTLGGPHSRRDVEQAAVVRMQTGQRTGTAFRHQLNCDRRPAGGLPIDQHSVRVAAE